MICKKSNSRSQQEIGFAFFANPYPNGDIRESKTTISILISLRTLSETPNIQASFLGQIRLKLPANIAFAEELADLLNISRDSAYRRIRGETLLSIEEVTLLSNKFGISLDALLAQTSETVMFHVRQVSTTGFTFEKYLESIKGNLEMINSFPDKELVYCAKDIPIFYYFPYPELAAFKMFFWMKTVLRYPELENKKFSSSYVSGVLKGIGDKIWSLYSRIPSTEIWSDETIIVVIKQLQFYLECGLFEDNKSYKVILGQLNDMIGNIRHFAETGTKSTKPGEQGGAFSLYKNEILIADNSIFFKMSDKRVAFLTYNTFNILSTSNPSFCRSTEDHLANLINKSSLISSSAEKERSKFFNRMEKEIKLAEEHLEE
ncbi:MULTISPECIES: helix-turn-helix domain-containing protein [unclassified Imperialibacter]|uniref:helix-turn-helix domain-containing protein n=1 Tax=unclassified Imperialibacter TaxID=2629706 RepID=UPI00186A8EFF|nr:MULTISPECIES: helix-turn-helix transcriptional regulator [unclassified Imperialibacter]